MNLPLVSQRIASLEEVTFNINTGLEPREYEIKATASGEATDLPKDFHRTPFDEKKAWIQGVMKGFIKDNIEDLLKEEYSLQGGIHFGKLVMKVVQMKEQVIIDPQDQK